MPIYKTKAVNNDTAYFKAKVDLRIAAIMEIDNPNVLDCFAGEGLLWKSVKEKSSKDIKLFSIDRVKRENLDWLGNNLNFLRSKDINQFNVIDLDAYGSPVKQLEIIFKRQWKGTIICTFICTISVNPDKILAKNWGFDSDMVRESPSLFGHNIFEMFYQYLAKNGVKNIKIVQSKKKKYLWFKIA